MKNETPKTVYGIITKTNYVFIREILEGTSDGVDSICVLAGGHLSNVTELITK